MSARSKINNFDGFTVKRPSYMVNLSKIRMATPRIRSSEATIFMARPDFPYDIKVRTGDPDIGLDESDIESIEIWSSEPYMSLIANIHVRGDEDEDIYVSYDPSIFLDDIYSLLYHMSNELELSPPA